MSASATVPSTEEDASRALGAEITKKQEDLVSHAKLRKTSRIVELAAIAALVTLWQASHVAVIPFITEPVFNKVIIPLLMLASVAAALFALLREAQFQMRNAREQADLEQLGVRKRACDKLSYAPDKRDTKDYFNALVGINVDNLARYYSLVKSHTQKSFIAALTMGVAGFVLLAAGLVSGFFGKASTDQMPYITSGAGVLTEFISAVFFYLYNQTVRQMKDYHDSLLDVQNILLALKLVDDTGQSQDRVKMIGQMLAFLLEKRVARIPEEARTPASAMPHISRISPKAS